jgi:hypothetical protein
MKFNQSDRIQTHTTWYWQKHDINWIGTFASFLAALDPQLSRLLIQMEIAVFVQMGSLTTDQSAQSAKHKDII